MLTLGYIQTAYTAPVFWLQSLDCTYVNYIRTSYYFQSGVHPDCVQCTTPVICFTTLLLTVHTYVLHMLLLSERATSRLRTVHYSSHLTTKFDSTHVDSFRAGYIQTAYSALLQSSDCKVWLYTCWLYICLLFQSGVHPDCVQCTTPVIWLQSLDCTYVNCTHVITFRAGYIQTAYSALLQSSDYKV